MLLCAGVLLALLGCTPSPPLDRRAADDGTRSGAAELHSGAGEDRNGAEGVVPAWAAEAVWYQIFPERFRNGDPSNDPTRASLDRPPLQPMAPADWEITPWTGDWYERAGWERALGPDFYDSHGVYHRRYGGDLQGVLDRLDYLEELGVNALYFNPLFHARSLHKYDGASYHHVDPHFGPDPAGDLALMAGETADPATWRWTQADRLFLELVEEAHRRGMRVILDGVWNHTGVDFFAFEDIRQKGATSPYADWYVVESFDDPSTPEDEFVYEGWWGSKSLPAWADTPDGLDLHPGPKAYIFAATRRWMDPDGDGDPSDGVDGWRLDVAQEVPVRFWVDWNARVRALNPEAYTVAETWEEASGYLEEAGFSAAMNYYGFAFPVKGFLVDGRLAPSEFAELVERRRTQHAPARQHALQNLVDSHDTERIASMIVNRKRPGYENPAQFDFDWGSHLSPRHDPAYDLRRPDARERRIQRLVALLQMTYAGAPMVYYGTEAGMWGADDPDDRMPMLWPDLRYDPQVHHPRGAQREPDEVAFDRSLFETYRAMIGLRRSEEALQRGDVRVLLADDDRLLFGFARVLGEDVMLVLMNRGEEASTVRLRLPAELAGSYELRYATGEALPAHGQEGGELRVELPPLEGVVLERAR